MTLLQITQTEVLGKLSFPFLLRFGINAVAAFLLIRVVYFPAHKNRENVFLFSIFNLLIFVISFLLNSVDIGMGSAFGLFAVFSFIQYRTVKMTTKDMTYMFLMIAIGLVNAVSIASWQELAVLNVLLLGFTYLLESSLVIRKEASQIITYTNLNLIRPDERQRLVADIEHRLGVRITHLSIKEVDFEKQNALIHICYATSKNEGDWEIDRQERPRTANGIVHTNGYTIVEKQAHYRAPLQPDALQKHRGKNKKKNNDYVGEHPLEHQNGKETKRSNGHLLIPNNLNQ